jgi:hypothetical protein
MFDCKIQGTRFKPLANLQSDLPQRVDMLSKPWGLLACHWVNPPVEGGQYSFHVEGLSKHLLDDANGIRAVRRAVKNILDYGGDTRLRTLCHALDAYREKVIHCGNTFPWGTKLRLYSPEGRQSPAGDGSLRGYYAPGANNSPGESPPPREMGSSGNRIWHGCLSISCLPSVAGFPPALYIFVLSFFCFPSFTSPPIQPRL